MRQIDLVYFVRSLPYGKRVPPSSFIQAKHQRTWSVGYGVWNPEYRDNRTGVSLPFISGILLTSSQKFLGARRTTRQHNRKQPFASPSLNAIHVA